MNILIVGAGLYGSTVARVLADAGHLVKVIDKRSHVAGNAYDYTTPNGIRIHKYGPHLFHTNNQDVVDFLSRFTEWTEYKHKVKALLSDGRYVTLPVNKETKAIVGEENVVDTFIRPYTKKMWGLDIEQIDKSVLARVPIRDDMNEYYFPNDKFQALPTAGYTEMVKKMLDHQNIRVELNTEFSQEMEDQFDHVFNSMPIDEYFGFCYGELPYRSVIFRHHTMPAAKILPTATVNFTHDGPCTRMTDWSQLPGHSVNEKSTVITQEMPCDYRDNDMERYYPVKDVDGKNRATYKAYENLANEKKNMTFIGRTGMYVYIDMDQAVASAIACASRFLKGSSV
jgi:UDP-galactopyranose mutase